MDCFGFQGKPIRMLDRFNSEIHIQIRPIIMSRWCFRHIQYLSDRYIFKPGEINVGEKQFFVMSQQPYSVKRNVRDLNRWNVFPRVFNFIDILLYQRFNFFQVLTEKTKVPCQFDIRMKLKFCFTFSGVHVDMHACFFAREKEEAISSFNEYGRTHPTPINSFHLYFTVTVVKFNSTWKFWMGISDRRWCLSQRHGG